MSAFLFDGGNGVIDLVGVTALFVMRVGFGLVLCLFVLLNLVWLCGVLIFWGCLF